MPKFKVGDTIQYPSGNKYTVVQLDDVQQQYGLQCKYGYDYWDLYTMIDAACTLIPIPGIVPTSTSVSTGNAISATPPPIVTLPLEKKIDQYINKLYKVIKPIPDSYSKTIAIGTILKVTSKSKVFLDEYYLETIIGSNQRTLAHPESWTWKTCLKEHVKPKCTCGLNSTWLAIHKKECPKDKHSYYCDISKE